MTVEQTPTTLIVETTSAEPCPIDFLGDTSDIVYFISMAHTERYGADHPLAKAAAILKRQLRVNMAPLLKFADARTENAAEERMLEGLWQDGEPLAEAARTMRTAPGVNHRPRPTTRHRPAGGAPPHRHRRPSLAARP